METEKIDDNLAYKVIGCAMKVHGTLGNSFQEVIYQRALAIELRRADYYSQENWRCRYFTTVRVLEAEGLIFWLEMKCWWS